TIAPAFLNLVALLVGHRGQTNRDDGERQGNDDLLHECIPSPTAPCPARSKTRSSGRSRNVTMTVHPFVEPSLASMEICTSSIHTNQVWPFRRARHCPLRFPVSP